MILQITNQQWLGAIRQQAMGWTNNIKIVDMVMLF